MKIGKYPVKHTYSIARIIADIISVGLAVLIVSATINFFELYEAQLMQIMTITDEGKEAMLANAPNYQTRQWLALIFPALMLAVFVLYIVLVLKSHKFSRFGITKKNAQQVSDAYTFCASMAKLPVLVIIADMMAIAQDKLLLWSSYDFSWFSVPSLLYAIIFVIIIRYTKHRLDIITAAPAEVSTNAIRVKAAVTEKKPAEPDSAAENKEDL